MTRGQIRFPIFQYPFEATHIAPSIGGAAVDHIVIEGPGIEISESGPSQDLARSDVLWWLSIDFGWLVKTGIDNPNSITQFDIEFLLTALNVCIDSKLFFTRFARKYYRPIELDGDFDNLSHGLEFANALTVSTSLPNRVFADSEDINTLFREMLKTLEGDESDIQKAVNSYRAAIQSFNTEIHARLLYSVCENLLISGDADAAEKDKAISDISSLDYDEAVSWRHLVNRTKHPDRGTNYSWEATFEEIPPPIEFRMREAANAALKKRLL